MAINIPYESILPWPCHVMTRTYLLDSYFHHPSNTSFPSIFFGHATTKRRPRTTVLLLTSQSFESRIIGQKKPSSCSKTSSHSVSLAFLCVSNGRGQSHITTMATTTHRNVPALLLSFSPPTHPTSYPPSLLPCPSFPTNTRTIHSIDYYYDVDFAASYRHFVSYRPSIHCFH